ncbi:hypothetical protein D0Z03_001838 [Geotrichum reessii]|nr:hypothetical protein D0Z03_001838 [Galactomyces reessii]
MSGRNRSKSSYKSPPYDHHHYTDSGSSSPLPPPPAPVSGSTDRRLNLWRAISNELNTLSTIQKETQNTTRTSINENSMSGVLAVYDADGNRVLQDFIFNNTDPDGTVDSKIRDIESLKSSYEKNKKKLLEEKKKLELIIGSLKKIVGDAGSALSFTGGPAGSLTSLSGASASGSSSSSNMMLGLSAGGTASGVVNSGSSADLPLSATKKRRYEEDSISPTPPAPKRSYSTNSNSNRPDHLITIGSQVAFRLHKQRINIEEEEEWIQCEVTKVSADGNRYEVRDPEPDENGNPGQSYKASFRDLIRIPPETGTSNLPNYPIGAKVLARYPETTTFYRAEVMGTTSRGGKCRLKFVGEEEEGKEQEVERRVVLPIPHYR